MFVQITQKGFDHKALKLFRIPKDNF